MVNASVEELDEAEFIDSVTFNLKEGRFLLLIVGDGIREIVEDISNFLQKYANLRFTFVLIEQAIYKLSEKESEGLLVQPRVLLRTIEIERVTIRLEGSSLVIEEPPPLKFAEKAKRVKITEEEFYKRLDQDDPVAPKRLPEFKARCRDH